MSMRDDALVRENKTVGGVCEEAGSCDASASSVQPIRTSLIQAIKSQITREKNVSFSSSVHEEPSSCN